MSGINPYGSSLLNNLFGQNTNATSVQSAQILDTPTTLKNLATNLILKGEVIAQNAGREAVIRTDRGELTVRLKNDLPVGSKVDIQIPSGQQAKEAIIQPSLAKAIQQNQQAQQQQQPATQTQTPQTASTNTIADVKNLQVTATQATQNITNTLSNFNIGQAVRITPLPPAQQNGLALQNFTVSAPLPVTVSATIAQVSLPTILPAVIGKSVSKLNTTISTPSNSGSTIQLPQTLISTSSSTPQAVFLNGQPTQPSNLQAPIIEIAPVRIRIGAPLSANLSPTALTPQTTPQTQISAVHPPPPLQTDARLTNLTPPAVQMNSNAIQTASPQPPFSLTNTQVSAGQIVATVTGFVNADGNPIIQTVGANNQVQYSTLHYPAKNLPVGTQITLNPTGVTLPTATNTTQSWQNMVQFVDEMTSVFPAMTTQSLMSLIPNAAQPKSFPAAAILFLAAAKGGDLSGWLGTKITRPADNNQTISKKIIESLMRDVATQTGRVATPSDPPMVQANADWRGHILPLILGADIHQATLWAKDDDGKNADQDVEKKIGVTRFVVDLKLSRMGDVYFDGLIHPEKQTFDLALITQRQISDPMQNTIKSIWYKTLGGLGLDGVITFKETV